MTKIFLKGTKNGASYLPHQPLILDHYTGNWTAYPTGDMEKTSTVHWCSFPDQSRQLNVLQQTIQ